ncbi:MAG TPA: hypothetical protein VJU58_04345, partial [Microbacterium sp.]|nr:hypothetical protein [Microbacterium sp.]
HGFGLDGMRERVALAGGAFHVASAPGDGATLTVELPAVPHDAPGVAGESVRVASTATADAATEVARKNGERG